MARSVTVPFEQAECDERVEEVIAPMGESESMFELLTGVAMFADRGDSCHSSISAH
ncbi:MAG: hypothetical protein ABI862_19585 [Ilumatobacteraceae bacterium]